MTKLYKFSASFCQPCKVLSKTLESVDLGEIALEDIDIDQHVDIASKFNLRGVPTMVLLDKNGNELSRKVGALNAIQIKQWLEDCVQ